MNHLVEYRIPYLGLNVGKHYYEFSLSDAFFGSFEQAEIQQGDVRVDLELDRQVNMLVLDFHLAGWVVLPCDRCGQNASVPLEGRERLIIKMGDETGSTDEEILVLGPQEHLIDLSQYLYEYVHLLAPTRREHSDPSACDQEALEKLRAIETEEDKDPGDPRWDKLKGLTTN